MSQGTKTVRRVLFVSGTQASATLRYRVRLAEEALRSRGVRTGAVHFTEPSLRSWVRDADVIALYRVPATTAVLGLLHWARGHGVPVTFDVDDRVFASHHADDLPFLAQLAPAVRRQFVADLARRGAVAALVDRASAATDPLVRELAGVVTGPVELVPNGVGQVALAAADAAMLAHAPEGNRAVRLGYFSGSATHDKDWASIEPDVVEVLRTAPQVELWLVGRVTPSAALGPFGARVRRVAPVPWQDLFALLAQVDINLAPLAPSPFTEAKSAIKWLEAALVCTPTVATATEPFAHAARDGEDAILLQPGTSWSGPLQRLVDDAGERTALGEAARGAAFARFGPELQADRYLAFFQAATQDSGGAPPPRAALARARGLAPRVWSPGVTLEAYPFPASATGLDLTKPAWASPLSGVRRGARATASSVRRTGRKVADTLQR